MSRGIYVIYLQNEDRVKWRIAIVYR